MTTQEVANVSTGTPIPSRPTEPSVRVHEKTLAEGSQSDAEPGRTWSWPPAPNGHCCKQAPKNNPQQDVIG